MRYAFCLKKIILLLVLNIVCLNLFYSQTSEIDLHKKYWYYKTRFNNDFVSIGLGDGQSIPFNQRGWNDNFTYTAPTNVLKTGDASAQLGIYIGVLATEYKLLKDKGQDVSKVKHELFCALNAVNRLDYRAEPIISANDHPDNPNTSTLSASLNGFFVRDDIPEHFVKNHYAELNYYNQASGYTGIGAAPNTYTADKGFTQINPQGQLITTSSYQSFNDPANTNDSDPPWNSTTIPNKSGVLEGMEESQDQLYYLLMGTSLVSKLVAAGETDGSNSFLFGVGNSDLRKEAINISDRLISHVKNSAGGLWRIRNPANNNSYVQVGDVALAYAYALDNAGCFIKHNDDFPSYVVGPYLRNPCNDFRNAASASSLGWDAIVQTNGGQTVDMQGFYHAMSAICNCSLESRNFLNTIIEAQIKAAQAALANALGDIQDQINKLPKLARALLNTLLNFANTLIAATTYLIGQLTLGLISPVKINTTQERLIYNNYKTTVVYPGCPNTPDKTIVGSKEYFGIFLWKVLHPNPSAVPSWLQQVTSPVTSISYSTVKQDLKSILDAAPCQGNYNFYPNRPGPEWGNPNRIDRMDATYRYNTTCVTAFPGEYHGLDYMLLHNLYYLAEGATTFINYSERNITYGLPVGNNFTTANKNTLGGYEYITASNVINSNAAADYRAGKEISLLPNFSVVQGADFSARIDPYACGANNQYNGEMLRTNNQSTDYAGDGKSKKPTKKESLAEDNNLTSEQNKMVKDFREELDSLFKVPNFSLQSLGSKVEVYPNPNDGNFNISFNLTNVDNIDIVIIDALGKVVFTQKHIVGFFILPLDLSGVSKGIYLARFENSNGEIFTKKITID